MYKMPDSFHNIPCTASLHEKFDRIYPTGIFVVLETNIAISQPGFIDLTDLQPWVKILTNKGPAFIHKHWFVRAEIVEIKF